MADYGAPVFPFLAVGGYKGERTNILHRIHVQSIQEKGYSANLNAMRLVLLQMTNS